MAPKLNELIIREYPHRKIETDDNSVTVSATRQRGIWDLDGTDIDWSSIEKQPFDWGDLFLVSKKLKLMNPFNYMYIENTQDSTVSRSRTTDREELHLLLSTCFKNETNKFVTRKKFLENTPLGKRSVYALMRCPGSC